MFYIIVRLAVLFVCICVVGWSILEYGNRPVAEVPYAVFYFVTFLLGECWVMSLKERL